MESPSIEFYEDGVQKIFCDCEQPLGVEEDGVWICSDCRYEIDEDRYTFEE